MEDDLLSLVLFKLMLIVISHDFKNIKKGLTPTITSLQRNNVIWTQLLKTKEKDLKVFKKVIHKTKNAIILHFQPMSSRQIHGV
jgi:hypothetical protein